MYRVAVCLSGQSRSWSTTYPSILRYFSTITPHYGTDDVQVDYFIHTWNRNWWQTTNKNVIADDLDAIPAAFSAKGFRVDDQNVYEPSGWYGLFTSFNWSVMMKREYELERNFEYDLVVKSRLDVAFPPDASFKLHRIEPMVAYATHRIGTIAFEHYQRNFNDIFFYSDSPTMDLLTDTHRWFHAERVQNPDINNRLGPGAMLYRFMTEHGIHPECSNHIEHIIVREGAQGLDVLAQYEAVKKHHDDFYK